MVDGRLLLLSPMDFLTGALLGADFLPARDFAPPVAALVLLAAGAESLPGATALADEPVLPALPVAALADFAGAAGLLFAAVPRLDAVAMGDSMLGE